MRRVQESKIMAMVGGMEEVAMTLMRKIRMLGVTGMVMQIVLKLDATVMEPMLYGWETFTYCFGVGGREVLQSQDYFPYGERSAMGQPLNR